MFVDALGALLFTMFYLKTLQYKGDFVQAAFVLAAVYYGCVWLVYQTTESVFNPAIAVSVGFDNLWNFTLMGQTEDTLTNWMWAAWIIGPFLGSALAVPFI